MKLETHENLKAETKPPEDQPIHVDLRKPGGWTAAVTAFLQALTPEQADAWHADLRVTTSVAGRIIRDQVYARMTGYCYVCRKPFKNGIPACEAGYYDAERNWIKVYGCDQSEYPELLRMTHAKEEKLAEQTALADKAASEAATAARRKVLQA